VGPRVVGEPDPDAEAGVDEAVDVARDPVAIMMSEGRADVLNEAPHSVEKKLSASFWKSAGRDDLMIEYAPCVHAEHAMLFSTVDKKVEFMLMKMEGIVEMDATVSVVFNAVCRAFRVVVTQNASLLLVSLVHTASWPTW